MVNQGQGNESQGICEAQARCDNAHSSFMKSKLKGLDQQCESDYGVRDTSSLQCHVKTPVCCAFAPGLLTSLTEPR